MNAIINRPIPRGSFDMFRFSYDYHKQLENLAIGEQIVVNGFENKEELKKFASIMLIPHSESDRVKNYEYKINEKDLTYVTRRID